MEVWFASFPGRFTPDKSAPSACWKGSWVDPKVSVIDMEKRKNFYPCRLYSNDHVEVNFPSNFAQFKCCHCVCSGQKPLCP